MAEPTLYKLPPSVPRSQRIPIDPALVQEAYDLYIDARHLDAYELVRHTGPLASWQGARARSLAADIANCVGAGRLSDLLDLSAYREDPAEDWAWYGHVRTLNQRKGPLTAWKYLQDHPIQPAASDYRRFRHLVLQGNICRHFRDFEGAAKFLDEARPLAERPEYVVMEESYLLHAQDRLDEALASARAALALRRTFQSAQILIANVLGETGREEEALQFVREMLEFSQSQYLTAMHVRLLTEHERFAEALPVLDFYDRLTPLAEKRTLEWAASHRVDCYYRLGQMDEARSWAEKIDSDYYRAFAAKLKAGETGRRVRLPVKFVRQDHHTCAPATLTALATFWGAPIDHDQVAESICYDGTYDHQERKWAEENGFAVREFRIDWESSRTLLDRGIPFELGTAQPGSAHAQAVVGYDELWHMLIIREPSERSVREFDWKKTEELYRAIGPRGMALVPRERPELLEGLDLPESQLYEASYRLNRAIEEHRREEAVAQIEKLKEIGADERLTLLGQRRLADYDGNVPEQLDLSRRLLALYPGDERHTLSLLYGLRQLGSREDRLAVLRPLMARKTCHPLVWREYAAELSEDPRDLWLAWRYLRRSHASMPSSIATVLKMADLMWEAGRIEEAAELYRFGAYADDKQESVVRSYFNAARRVRRTEEALAFLRTRFERYGDKSMDPARTLFSSLHDISRSEEAFEVLEKALARRPDDGALMGYAADCYASWGHWDRARALLAEAESRCPRAQWLRTATRLATERGDLAEARQYWEEIAEREPLSRQAHREVAGLVASAEGKAAAIEYLRGVCAKFPYNVDLNSLLIERLADEDREQTVAQCRQLVAFHPTNAWATRELAEQLGRAGALDEALAIALQARDLEPRSTSGHNVLAKLYGRAGRFEEARAACRTSIRLDVDNDFAIDMLLDLSSSAEDKKKELLFIREELLGQVVYGQGLTSFYQQAKRVLPPEETLRYLQEAVTARPDLWDAWYVSARHAVETGSQEEAVAAARELTRRFPMTPGSWRTLAGVLSTHKDWAGAAEALGQAVALSPGWSAAVCEWAEALDYSGQPDRAIAELQKAIRSAPGSWIYRGYLASIYRRQGKKTEAMEHLRRALELSPTYGWAWDELGALDEAENVLRLAERLTEMRPGEANSWLVLADQLSGPENDERRLAAYDRALALEPQNVEAHDRRAHLFAAAGRYEEALAACRPAAWAGHRPVRLQGREAAIERDRGNLARAIELMEQAVVDDGEYIWGWSELSDWYMANGDAPKAVVAAERIVRLRPKQGRSYGYRADARLAQGDRYGAIEDLRHACYLDPSYGFALWTLWDLVLEDDNFVEAEQLLPMLALHGTSARLLQAEVALLLKRGKAAEAESKLEALCVDPKANTSDFDALEKVFKFVGAEALLDAVLDRVAKFGDANVAALDLWVERHARRNDFAPVAATLRPYVERDARAAVAGVRAVLQEWGARGRSDAFIRELLTRRRAWLRKHDILWGNMGYVLFQARREEECAAWLADWETRPRRQEWILFNLYLALQNLARDREASKVSRTILELDPRSLLIRAWEAFHAALAGDVSRTEEEKETKITHDAEGDLVLKLARLVAEATTASGPGLDSIATKTRALWKQAGRAERGEWRTIRAYHRAMDFILSRSGSIAAYAHRLKCSEWMRRMKRLARKWN